EPEAADEDEPDDRERERLAESAAVLLCDDLRSALTRARTLLRADGRRGVRTRCWRARVPLADGHRGAARRDRAGNGAGAGHVAVVAVRLRRGALAGN